VCFGIVHHQAPIIDLGHSNEKDIRQRRGEGPVAGRRMATAFLAAESKRHFAPTVPDYFRCPKRMFSISTYDARRQR
jgi:hypothetical protein